MTSFLRIVKLRCDVETILDSLCPNPSYDIFKKWNDGSHIKNCEKEVWVQHNEYYIAILNFRMTI